MNSPIQWFLLLLCDRRTAPTLFSTLAWYPPVGGTRRIGKDSPVHRPDGLRPSRRRITACDQRFEGYPSMLACYIRHAVGTHELPVYRSAGQCWIIVSRQQRPLYEEWLRRHPGIGATLPRATLRASLQTSESFHNPMRPGALAVLPMPPSRIAIFGCSSVIS